MQTLAVAENSNADLKKKMTAEEQARNSADSTLDSVERQAESQRKLAREPVTSWLLLRSNWQL